MQTLGELMNASRVARKLTLKGLGKKVGVTGQWLDRLERNERKPTFDLLVAIYQALVDTPPQASMPPLSVWLWSWLQEEVKTKTKGRVEKEEIQKEIDAAVIELNRLIAWKPQIQRTLEDFPYAFEPLTIVCGDRRESPPTTRGDLFAFSLSITDLTFLPTLGLRNRHTTIRSDKLFAVMDKAYLQREFGHSNLLIIGSPAVNFAARLINNHAVFRFQLDLRVKEWDQKVRSMKALDDAGILLQFWKLSQNMGSPDLTAVSDPEKETAAMVQALVQEFSVQRGLKAFMHRFRSQGIVDPADGTIQGFAFRANNDFALISLAPNPFADTADYICIMVAGIHGPGTAHALKMLAEDNFQEHPFGGVIEVHLDLVTKGWADRFQHPTDVSWQTKPYTPDKIVGNLEHELEQIVAGTHDWGLTDKEVRDCIAFVRRLAGMADA